jgi:hypothetical protein
MYTERTDSVMVYLKGRVGPLVGDQRYRSVILLRNKALLSAYAKINLGSAFCKMAAFNATNSVDVFENGLYAYAWKMYFFL